MWRRSLSSFKTCHFDRGWEGDASNGGGLGLSVGCAKTPMEQEAQVRQHTPPTQAPSPAPLPPSLPPPLPRQPAVSLSLVAPAPYVRQARAPQAVDLVQMRRRRRAASLTPDTVAAESMAPWWHPLEAIGGFFDVDDLVVPVLSPLPCDGDWEGRNGALIHAAPRHELQNLRTILRTVPVLSPFRGKALSGWRTWCHPDLLGNTQEAHSASSAPHEQPHPPCVLLTRYKDNNYILFVSIPPPLVFTVKRAVFALLQAVYDIPLKWEPVPPITPGGGCKPHHHVHWPPPLEKRGGALPGRHRPQVGRVASGLCPQCPLCATGQVDPPA